MAVSSTKIDSFFISLSRTSQAGPVDGIHTHTKKRPALGETFSIHQEQVQASDISEQYAVEGGRKR